MNHHIWIGIKRQVAIRANIKNKDRDKRERERERTRERENKRQLKRSPFKFWLAVDSLVDPAEILIVGLRHVDLHFIWLD